MDPESEHLEIGERAPDFILPADNGTATRFYGFAGGHPTILMFFESGDTGTVAVHAQAIKDRHPGVEIFGVVAAVDGQKPAHQLPFKVFVDTEGKVRKGYRLPADFNVTVFVLNPNLRVTGVFSFEPDHVHLGKIFAVLATPFIHDEPVLVEAQAPVLFVPHVLTREICDFLIGCWGREGNVETGVEKKVEGQHDSVVDETRKIRRDHVVEDSSLLKQLTATVGRRVMPEVKKAFAFEATRFEGFKIVCYESSKGGFFEAHRDNLSPTTAHRKFALSINLNSDYKGGEIRFPEYGARFHRPAGGCALVFSCAHLHEVNAVTDGRRFGLLSFLY